MFLQAIQFTGKRGAAGKGYPFNIPAFRNVQFLIATHSPILLAYPRATIYSLDYSPLQSVEYEDTEHYRLTRDFLNNRARFFRHLLEG